MNKKTTPNTRLVHWLADPDESGQTVHSDSFAPALASLIFNSLCCWATVRMTFGFTINNMIKRQKHASREKTVEIICHTRLRLL